MFSRWPGRVAASAGAAPILPGLSGDFASAARDPAQFRAVFGSAVEIGAQVLRFPLDWAQVERSPGAYDWSGHDALHGELLWNGLKALPAVINAPDWLAEDCAVTPGGLRYPASDRGLNALSRLRSWGGPILQQVPTVHPRPGGLASPQRRAQRSGETRGVRGDG